VLCKTSPQLSLFDVNNVFPNALPKEDWCYLYRDQIYPLIDEDIFKELYPGECGRPNRSIKKAVSILIFMGMEKHTWRGAEFQQAFFLFTGGCKYCPGMAYLKRPCGYFFKTTQAEAWFVRVHKQRTFPRLFRKRF